MPVDQSFAMFAAQSDDAFRAGADAAMRAGLQWTAANMKYVLIPAVIVFGLLIAVGQMSKGRALSFSGRLAILIFAAVSMAYSTMFADLMVDGIPNEIASSINGGGLRITSAQQWDVLNAGVSNFTANVRGQATGISNIPTRMAADLANGYAKVWLRMFFYMWIIARIAMRLLIASTAFLLLMIMYDHSRGWLQQQIGKMVGIIVWQLMSAIMTSVMLAGAEVYLRDAIANPGASLDMQIDRIWDIGGHFLGCFIMVLLLPALSAVGSGYVAGGIQGGVMATAAGAITAASRSMAGSARVIKNYLEKDKKP